MKHFILLVSFLITIVFLSSCSAPDCSECTAFHGYQIVTIDSVDYIIVYGSYGFNGICPKVIK